MLLNSDFQSFQHCFKTRLSKMLSADELGAFILVLANSMQDLHLQQVLAPPLDRTFTKLKMYFEANGLNASADDLQVFRSLLNSGIDQYQAWEQKMVGPWLAAFNPLRALRPKRASGDVFTTLNKPFDEQSFHFDKPFLQPEVLCEERFTGQDIRVLYQKFPFVPYHLLILLDPRGHHPQFMTEWAHQLAWDLTDHMMQRIPGFGLAFNSLGASASVNHLHVHGFVHSELFAIERDTWHHNGGEKAYPLVCQPLDSVAESWALIKQMHCNNQPYNLLYRAGVCYVITRPAQGLRLLPSWLPDAGWYELSGGFNLVSRQDFDSLQAGEIEAGLALLKL